MVVTNIYSPANPSVQAQVTFSFLFATSNNMLFKSRWTVDVPNKDLLSFIFGESFWSIDNYVSVLCIKTDDWKHGWDKTLFVDADDPSRNFRAGDFLSMVKKIGHGLRKGAGVQTGDVVMLCSANRVDIPALVLGIICAGATMSGVNPSFSHKGERYLFVHVMRNQ